MNLQAQTLSRFASQHKTIKKYIDNLPPEAIYNRLNSDKYSIHETIAYLTRYHYIFLERLKGIMNSINPFFGMYKPDEDPEYHFAVARTTGSLLHELYRMRDHIMLELEDMSPEQFSRVGTHAILGRMDISQWIDFFVLHESNQLFRIFKLSGSFWSMEFKNYSNVIYLPRLAQQVDELAG
ncbi:DinB family protein [Hufsiella ginkgonis]|uniref:DinB family protein n=1 Tax=Hufsiella ginkgonis TaxID=2695274 RepID=A0A7K1XZ49_9SPHI|nr:DinB family protein [Hufsiella ginkgonis]MXV16281.1 DinB family protein [Hufsiella ginkgonis]